MRRGGAGSHLGAWEQRGWGELARETPVIRGAWDWVPVAMYDMNENRLARIGQPLAWTPRVRQVAFVHGMSRVPHGRLGLSRALLAYAW